MKVIKSFKNGSSAPILIDDNGQLLFVKLRAGMSGEHSLLNEYLATQVGIQLGLPILSPSWILLDESLDISNLDIEIKDLVEKSYGWNIAFDYQSEMQDLTIAEIKKIDSTVTSELFLFDLVMLNIDRSPANSNLIGNFKSLYSIDYDSSLLIMELLSGVTFSNNLRVLQQLRNNPLYQELSTSRLTAFLERLNVIDFRSLLYTIPKSLLSDKDRTTLLKGIFHKKKLNWNLNDSIDKVKQLSQESAADQKARSNQNQSKFKKNFEGRL